MDQVRLGSYPNDLEKFYEDMNKPPETAEQKEARMLAEAEAKDNKKKKGGKKEGKKKEKKESKGKGKGKGKGEEGEDGRGHNPDSPDNSNIPLSM